jgi:PAS domain S-box-containing protein
MVRVAEFSMEVDLVADWPVGVIHVNAKGNILFVNDTCKQIFKIEPSRYEKYLIHKIVPTSTIIKAIKEGETGISFFERAHERYYLVELPIKKGETGSIILIPEENFGEFINGSDKVKELKQELEAIMNLSGELVTITDGEGKVLRVNATCEQIMGVKEHEFVGKHAFSLEDNGIIDISSTSEVIKQKRAVTLSQVTKSGRRLFVRGYPIYAEDGTLSKIINISKDVTEESTLRKNLEDTKKIVTYYQKEIKQIQDRENKIIVKSKVMEELYNLVCRIADSDATVILQGETGVGKEVIARTIHQVSSRKERPFIKINCGALPESLIESELFGYSKGTFTGGNKEGKEGLLAAADQGSFFLDEIGELPLNLQSKVLQVLQEKEFTPLGKTKPTKINVRFIAATNRDLEEMVKAGTFRADLYYRLFVIPIMIPPLKERKEDIPFLVKHFLDIYNEKYQQSKRINYEVLQLFLDYDWKGNIRELQNTIERLVVTVQSEKITYHHLPKKMLPTTTNSTNIDENVPLKEAVASFEKIILERTIATSFTLKEVSTKLSVDISTISRKCKKYNINFAKLQL